MGSLGLGLDIPAEVLYKLHTGMDPSYSDDGWDDAGSVESYIYLERSEDPSLEKTREILNEQNRIEILEKWFRDCENPSTTSVLEGISQKLHENVTPNYCFICKKSAQGASRGHYKFGKHYRKVQAWIKLQIEGVPVERIFCNVCNMALLKADLVIGHYKSEDHMKLSHNYCHICMRRLASDNMSKHTQTKAHRRKLGLEIPENKKSTTFIGTNNEWSVNKTSEHAEIASALRALLPSEQCKICKRKKGLQAGHYQTRQHITKVYQWIKSKISEFQFHKNNIDSLYCDACNEVFDSSHSAELHYSSMNHHESSSNYCKHCRKHMANIKAHFLTKRHTRVVCPNVPATEQEPNLETPEFFNAEINGIAEKLKDMLKGQHCGICKEDVNLRQFDHHYLQRDHTLSTRKWLDEEIRKAKVEVNKDLLYCEPCFTGLCGTGKAWDHYRNGCHLYNENTYCSICVFRGSPDELEEHNLNQHPVLVQESSSNQLKLEQKNEIEQPKAMRTTEGCGENAANPEDLILQEVSKIIDKVYFSKKIPFDVGLVYLKRLNQEISQLKTANDYDEDLPLPLPSLPKAPKGDISMELTRMKLTMEFLRLKMVLTNSSRFPPGTAIQYVEKLNRLLTDLTETDKRFYDVDSVFDIGPLSDLPLDKQKEILDKELEELEATTTKSAEFKAEMTLDCIEQFNVQLESLIDNDFLVDVSD